MLPGSRPGLILLMGVVILAMIAFVGVVLFLMGMVTQHFRIDEVGMTAPAFFSLLGMIAVLLVGIIVPLVFIVAPCKFKLDALRSERIRNSFAA